MPDDTEFAVSNKFNLKIRYKGVGDYEIIKLSDVLGIDETILTEHYADQATLFGYFAAQLAEADRLVGVAKMKLEQEYAAADSHYRDEFKKQDLKYTETVIRGEVSLDEDYQKAQDKLQQAQYNVAIIKSIVNALKMKADMLISMGAHMRQEYDMTGMSIREQSMDKAMDEVKKSIKRKKKSEQV